MNQPVAQTGLRLAITRVAAASAMVSAASAAVSKAPENLELARALERARVVLNEALVEFSGVAEPILRPIVRAEVLKRRVGGPDGMLADAADILNQLLFRLTTVAHQCKAGDDAAAKGWLKQVVVNLVEDEAKTPRRRLQLLFKRLLGLGYHHESWGTGEHQSNQEPPAHVDSSDSHGDADFNSGGGG